MKVILKETIDALGDAGKIIEVKPGYARNFLIPKGKAVLATNSNLKVYEQELKLGSLRAQKGKKLAEELAAKLSKISVTSAVQVGEEDKIFGSVTSHNIADLLKEQGYEIDRKKIVLDEPLKALGVYDVAVKLHPEVEAKIKVWVVRE
ncbi:MAG: 50S ribosomal protein L9 [Calditrichaeota bacterium]|nr:50S ribosomal protein L9 [Calditrichota bacterium]